MQDRVGPSQGESVPCVWSPQTGWLHKGSSIRRCPMCSASGWCFTVLKMLLPQHTPTLLCSHTCLSFPYPCLSISVSAVIAIMDSGTHSWSQADNSQHFRTRSSTARTAFWRGCESLLRLLKVQSTSQIAPPAGSQVLKHISLWEYSHSSLNWSLPNLFSLSPILNCSSIKCFSPNLHSVILIISVAQLSKNSTLDCNFLPCLPMIESKDHRACLRSSVTFSWARSLWLVC